MGATIKKYGYWVAIAGLIIALLFQYGRYRETRKTDAANLVALTDSVSYYKNALGTETASKKTLQLDKKQLQGLLIKKDKDLQAATQQFANLHQVVKYVTQTKYDTITVVYRDTVPLAFTRTGKAADKWYSFRYKSTQAGFTIDSLTFPNTAMVVTGTKRKWFLGKETLTTDITNTNPYMKVTGITATEVIVPTPIYKKWYVWLLAGVGAGLLIK